MAAAFFGVLLLRTKGLTKRKQAFTKRIRTEDSAARLRHLPLEKFESPGNVAMYAAGELLASVYPEIFANCQSSAIVGAQILQFHGMLPARRPLIIVADVGKLTQTECLLSALSGLLLESFQPQTELFIVLLFDGTAAARAAKSIEKSGRAELILCPSYECEGWKELASCGRMDFSADFADAFTAAAFVKKLKRLRLAGVRGNCLSERAVYDHLDAGAKVAVSNKRLLPHVYERVVARIPHATCGIPTVAVHGMTSGKTCEVRFSVYTYYGHIEPSISSKLFAAAEKFGGKLHMTAVRTAGETQSENAYAAQYGDRIYSMSFGGTAIPAVCRENEVYEAFSPHGEVLRFSPPAGDVDGATAYYANFIREWK